MQKGFLNLSLLFYQLTGYRFEHRKWSHLEVEALNAYITTLPQFAIRETLRKAWVAILDYYQGNRNETATLQQTAEHSPQGTGISQVHVELAVQQELTSSDERSLSDTPATSDQQPMPSLHEQSVRQAGQSTAGCFPSHSLGPNDEVQTSTDPWFYFPPDPGGPRGGATEVTADNANASTGDPYLFLCGPDGDRPSATVDEILLSADPWLNFTFATTRQYV
jgi:hypothetical protein